MFFERISNAPHDEPTAGQRGLQGLQLEPGHPPLRAPLQTPTMSRWQVISRLLNACILKMFRFIIVRNFKAWMFMIAIITNSKRLRDPRLKGGPFSQPRGVRPWEAVDPTCLPTGRAAFCLWWALFGTNRGPWIDVANLLTHRRGL